CHLPKCKAKKGRSTSFLFGIERMPCSLKLPCSCRVPLFRPMKNGSRIHRTRREGRRSGCNPSRALAPSDRSLETVRFFHSGPSTERNYFSLEGHWISLRLVLQIDRISIFLFLQCFRCGSS